VAFPPDTSIGFSVFGGRASPRRQHGYLLLTTRRKKKKDKSPGLVSLGARLATASADRRAGRKQNGKTQLGQAVGRSWPDRPSSPAASATSASTSPKPCYEMDLPQAAAYGFQAGGGHGGGISGCVLRRGDETSPGPTPFHRDGKGIFDARFVCSTQRPDGWRSPVSAAHKPVGWLLVGLDRPGRPKPAEGTLGRWLFPGSPWPGTRWRCREARSP